MCSAQCTKCPCGQQCLYVARGGVDNTIRATHITPVIRYKDDLFFRVSDGENGSCDVFGHSHSTARGETSTARNSFSGSHHFRNLLSILEKKLPPSSSSSSLSLPPPPPPPPYNLEYILAYRKKNPQHNVQTPIISNMKRTRVMQSPQPIPNAMDGIGTGLLHCSLNSTVTVRSQASCSLVQYTMKHTLASSGWEIKSVTRIF